MWIQSVVQFPRAQKAQERLWTVQVPLEPQSDEPWDRQGCLAFWASTALHDWISSFPPYLIPITSMQTAILRDNLKTTTLLVKLCERLACPPLCSISCDLRCPHSTVAFSLRHGPLWVLWALIMLTLPARNDSSPGFPNSYTCLLNSGLVSPLPGSPSRFTLQYYIRRLAFDYSLIWIPFWALFPLCWEDLFTCLSNSLIYVFFEVPASYHCIFIAQHM